ncbi:MAG: B12-binding domain-containing radical SAM protein, partial [Polyangiaceae bacterium]
MRVLLVHPEFPTTYWGFQNSLPFIGKRATLPPLGLLTLGALLPPTWQARLSDLNVAPLRDDDMLWADAVLVGGMLVQSPSALEVVRRAHALGRKTIVGGAAVTTSPSLFDEAGHIFLGEAEGRIDAVVRAVEGDGEPHVLGEIPEAKPDVSKSPRPLFELIDLRSYQAMSVQYSRGCPFTCEFCDIIEMFGRVPRYKSPPQVLAELDALKALGWRGPVFFVDDNFIGNKRAAKQLLPEVACWQRENGFPFSFYTEASVNLAADATLLRMMVEAGFDSVFLGIETPSVEALRETKKKQNVVDLREAVDTITRAGLDVMGGFIVGFDADGPEAFAAQREFISSSPIPLAMVGLLTALPGTQLWRRLEREGRLRDTSNGDAFTRPNFETSMGDELLLAGYKELMKDLYSAQSYYARCHRVIERVGPPVAGARFQPRDLVPAARAIMGIGVLGSRRRQFWRLLAHGSTKGHHALRRAFMFAIQGEHLIRYTDETVVPRIERALSEVRAAPQPRVRRHVAMKATAPASVPGKPGEQAKPEESVRTATPAAKSASNEPVSLSSARLEALVQTTA